MNPSLPGLRHKRLRGRDTLKELEVLAATEEPIEQSLVNVEEDSEVQESSEVLICDMDEHFLAHGQEPHNPTNTSCMSSGTPAPGGASTSKLGGSYFTRSSPQQGGLDKGEGVGSSGKKMKKQYLESSPIVKAIKEVAASRQEYRKKNWKWML